MNCIDLNSSNTKIKLIKCLKATKQLNILKEKALAYKLSHPERQAESCNIPFYFVLTLDIIAVADYLSAFATVLLQEPFVAQETLRKLLHKYLQRNLPWPQLHNDKFQLSIRLCPFPHLPPLYSTPSSVVNPLGMFIFKGVLIGISAPIKYMYGCRRSTMFVCLSGTCRGVRTRLSTGERHESHKCTFCGTNEVEDTKARVYGDHVIGAVVELNGLLACQEGSGVCRSQNIQFLDDLSSKLELGMKYSITVMKGEGLNAAVSVYPLLPDSLQRVINGIHPLPLPGAISNIFSLIRQEVGDSPWNYVIALAASMSNNKFPLQSFLHLKTALLLSLASTGYKTPVSILALGECQELMTWCVSLSAWSQRPMPPISSHLEGGVMKEANMIFMEAGPLLIASQGICYLGNCSYLPSAHLQSITKAVESEVVELKTKSGVNTGESLNLVYPLKAAIWTHWPVDKHSVKDMKKLHTLINVFGIPFLSEIDHDDDLETNHLLTKAMGRKDEDQIKIPEKEIKQFIEKAAAQPVEMSQSAIDLIKNYFVSCRKERPYSLPVKSVQVLTGLSEAHARLSLRKTVTNEDVVAAIFLYDEAVDTLYGVPEYTSDKPTRMVKCRDLIGIVREMNATLSQFNIWLQLNLTTSDTGNTAEP